MEEHMARIDKIGIGEVVRVRIPMEVAYDLDKLQSVQKDILGRLGCLACCSGHDIRWEFERNFSVDEKLNVRSLG